MDFADLSEMLPAIQKGLHRSYRVERRAAPPTLRPYLDHLDEFTLRGGKRFRALMVLAGYHIATDRSPAPAIPAAQALEHFQSWMLIHDDIIDHSEERRGGPAMHRLLARPPVDGCPPERPEELGVGLGITLGDLEEPFTLQAILDTRVPHSRKLAALAEYVRMTRLTAYGQILDIRNGALPVERVTEADVLRVHRLKSAVYTVSSPLLLGATLGGGSRALLADLASIGDDIGVAFQLRDDLLGSGFGPEDLGKSANDIREGKRTLLVVRAWSRATGEGRRALSEALGNPRATPAQVAAARDVIESTGSREYSEMRIAALERRALRRLDRGRSIPVARRALIREISDRLVRRSR
jgi:geranylgeranyl diphosphate synthase type I